MIVDVIILVFSVIALGLASSYARQLWLAPLDPYYVKYRPTEAHRWSTAEVKFFYSGMQSYFLATGMYWPPMLTLYLCLDGLSSGPAPLHF